MSSAPLGLTIEETQAAIAKGDLTVPEATAAALQGLETIGNELNAVARVQHDDAMEQAEARQGQLKAGTANGALFGVPLAHKDLYYRKGWTIEAGAKLMADHRAPYTATTISKLEQAGALDIARLNTVEFALGTFGQNSNTGAVHNPWNPDHITGGSSSGSGATVAAGIVPGALGSDTGGSIRLPAAACGLIGLKPTAGLIGRSGIVPLSFSLDTAGPLTRTVRDAAIMLQAMAGYDENDAGSVNVPVPDYLADIERGIGDTRVGVITNCLFDPVRDEIADKLLDARKLLGSLGRPLREVTVEGLERTNRLTALIIVSEASALHSRWLKTRAKEYTPQTLSRMMAGLFVPAETYMRAMEFRRRFVKSTLAQAFREADVLFAPVWPYPIPTIAETAFRASPDYPEMVVSSGHCTRPINFLGFPAITLPCGLSKNGLPTAFQLIGRPFDEKTLLRVARTYEREQVLANLRPAVSVWNRD